MDLRKLAPWNWFNKENERADDAVPVKRRHFIGNNSMLTPSSNDFSDIDPFLDPAFNGYQAN